MEIQHYDIDNNVIISIYYWFFFEECIYIKLKRGDFFTIEMFDSSLEKSRLTVYLSSHYEGLFS